MNREKLEAIWRKLTADKKKFGIMVVLLAVGLLMWGRLLLRQVPRTATAVPDRVQVVTTLPNKTSAHPVKKTVDAWETVTYRPPGSTPRNLFQYDPRPYKRTTMEVDGVDIAKLPEEASDEAFRIAAVRKAAAGLTLQSVMKNQVPHAIINGQLVKSGERIEGFEIVQIADRTVLLKKDGIVVRIGM